MKKLNKLLALALAVILTLSLCTVAFADPTAKSADLTGHTYDAYQIFTGTQTEAPDTSAELGNIQWGAGVNPATFLGALQSDAAFEVADTSEGAAAGAKVNLFAGCEDAADVAVVASKFADKSPEAMAFARIAYDNKGTAAAADVDADTALDAGYYLIVDVTTNDDNDENFVNNLALLQLTKKGTLNIECKVDVPEVEKKILEDGKVLNCDKSHEHTPDCYKEAELKLDANQAAIGDYVKYEFTGTMPSDLANYDTYYYVFHDTLSKGLTYVTGDDNHPLTVKIVNGNTETDVTKYFYKGSEAVTNDNVATGETAITVGIADILAFNVIPGDETAPICTVDKDSKVVVTYYAQVNNDAVIGTTGNLNEVKLEYSNNPNDDGDGANNPPEENPGKNPKEENKNPTGVTPVDDVLTYVTQVKVFKVDEKNQPLTGAEFTLTGDALNKVLVYTETFEENEDGTFYKLANGTYTTEAPIVADYYREATAEDGRDGGYVLNNGEYTAATKEQLADANVQLYILVKANTDKYDTNFSAKYAATKNFVVKDTKATTPETVKGYVDDAGVVEFTGLKAGTYTLTESATPAGYNTVDPIEFTIDWTAPNAVVNGTETCTWSTKTANVSYVAADNAFELTVVNQKGSTLPETGGIGTTIFYVIGGILLVGAAVLLITKKRMGAEA